MKMSTSTASKWLNIEVVHREYGFSKSWLYKNTATRKLQFYKPAGRILFLKEDIDLWIKNSAVETAESILSAFHDVLLE
jgi:predicted DNA-binding transcriptional regulator AlpA